MVIALIAFLLGIMVGDSHWFTSEEPEATVKKQKVENTSSTVTKDNAGKLDKDTVIIQVVEKDSVVPQKDSQQQEEAQTSQEPAAKQPQQVKADVKTDKNPEAKTVAKTETPLKGYDSDPRVRTGAYYIMGVDKEVVMKEGQTLKSISRTYLGPDMECYVEALNGKNTKPGDKVKIPKLKLKKLLKNK